MIDLSKNNKLIRSELEILFCFLEDMVEDNDLNESREEIRSIVRQLAYLVLDEG